MQVYVQRIKNLITSLFLGVCILGALPETAYSEEKQTAVATFRDWAVFVGHANSKKVCYIASRPERSEASRENVRRGDIYLMVANRPADNVENEVSFAAGYPLKKQSTVTAMIESSKYDLFTQGEGAWMPSAQEDQKIVESMRKGTKIVLKGISTRGTRTTDTFSLIGFTDALTDAQKRCS